MNSPRRISLEIARAMLGDDLTKLEEQERRVLKHLEAREPISVDTSEVADREETRGSRVADAVARIGGSWRFIGAFFLFLAVWVSLNSVILLKQEMFDPYPFIFLNLVLSMLAAIQAPIIMMSQNRQAEKDRIAASHDYAVNLRSEIEILAMQQKLDRLRGEQHNLILAQQKEILHLLQSLAASLPEFSPPGPK